MDWKRTLQLRLFTFFKIRLLSFMQPVVLEANRERVVLKVPLNRRTKNHLGGMFLGSLCTGADGAMGFLLTQFISLTDRGLVGIVKEVHGKFLKRVEDDALFTCNDGSKIEDLIARARASSERIEDRIRVVVTVPTKFGNEPVAEFEMLVSVKAGRSGV